MTRLQFDKTNTTRLNFSVNSDMNTQAVTNYPVCAHKSLAFVNKTSCRMKNKEEGNSLFSKVKEMLCSAKQTCRKRKQSISNDTNNAVTTVTTVTTVSVYWGNKQFVCLMFIQCDSVPPLKMSFCFSHKRQKERKKKAIHLLVRSSVPVSSRKSVSSDILAGLD